jgi:hypothetical protein
MSTPTPINRPRVTSVPKPAGWARRSQAPYYKDFYGKQLQKDADAMLENRQDLVYRYDLWCNTSTGMSKNTLYNRVNQSIRYLLEHLDPEKKYSDWHAMTRVERVEYGVRVSFVPEYREGSHSNFGGELTTTREAIPKHLQEIDYWLEGDMDKPLIIENINLTAEQLNEVKTKLAQLDGIGKVLRYNSIKLIKTV